MKTAVIGMFWRTRAYFGGHQPVLTGNGVFGQRARSNPPLSTQTRQSGNSGKSLAGNGVQSNISRHCPPIPASLGTQAKIEEQIWRVLAGSRLVPPLYWRSMADLNIMNINWQILAERGVLWCELPSSTWRATDLLVSGSQQP